MVKERRFTVHDARKVDGCSTKFKSKDYSGVYETNRPSAAAMKALTQLCRAKKNKGQCTMFLTLREITQGNNKNSKGWHKALSIETLCFCPKDNLLTKLSFLCPNKTSSIKLSISLTVL